MSVVLRHACPSDSYLGLGLRLANAFDDPLRDGFGNGLHAFLSVLREVVHGVRRHGWRGISSSAWCFMVGGQAFHVGVAGLPTLFLASHGSGPGLAPPVARI